MPHVSFSAAFNVCVGGVILFASSFVAQLVLFLAKPRDRASNPLSSIYLHRLRFLILLARVTGALVMAFGFCLLWRG